VFPTEHCLRRGIDVSDQSLQIDGRYARGHIDHRQPKAFLTFPQIPLRTFPAAEISNNLAGTDDPAFGVFDGKHGNGNLKKFSSFGDTPRFVMINVLTSSYPT